MEQDNFDFEAFNSEVAPGTPAPEDDRAILEILNKPSEDTKPVVGRATNRVTDTTLSAKGALIAAQDTNDWLPFYQRIRQEQLNFSGESESLARIQENRRQQSIRMAQLATANLAINGEHEDPVAATQAYSNAFTEALKEIEREDIDKQLALDAASKYNPQTEEERNIFESVAGDALDEELIARQNVQKRVNQVAANTLSGDASAFWSGVAQQAIPLMEGEQMRRLVTQYEDMTGEKIDTTTWTGVDMGKFAQTMLSVGSAKKAFKQALDRLYIEDPQRAEETAATLLELLPSTVNVVHKNEFSAYFRLQEFFEEGGNYGEDTILGFAYEVPLDNLTSILDVAGAGGIVRGLTRPLKSVKTVGQYMKYRPGVLEKKLAGALKNKETAKKVQEGVENYHLGETIKRTTVDSTQPTAPANIIAKHNQDQATQMYEVALKGDDEAALATFGTTNKGDIAVHAHGPQIPDGAGNVEFRAQPNDPSITNKLEEIYKNIDARNLSEEELAVAHKKIQESVDIKGKVKLRHNLSSFKVEGNNGYIEAVYAPESGFWKLKTLFNHITFGLRNRGVTNDMIEVVREEAGKLVKVEGEELRRVMSVAKKQKTPKQVKQEKFAEDFAGKVQPGSLRDKMSKDPSGFDPEDPKAIPLSSDEARAKLDARNRLRKNPPGMRKDIPPGGYFIRVKIPYKVTHTDVEALTKPEITNNIFDKMFVRWKSGYTSDWGAGSLQQHLVDAASTFKDKFILAASNVTDRISALEKYFFKDVVEFRKKFEKLPKEQRAAMTEVIERNNREGIRFDPVQAKEDGWTEEMIGAMHDFRSIWDRIWSYTNRDLVKTFKARGYKILDDVANDTHLVVKPISRSEVTKHIDIKGSIVYDASKGKMVVITPEQVAKLYEDGGMIVQSRRAVTEGANSTKLVISQEKAGSSFTRALKDNEVVLPYREGYFSRRYKDNYFVTRLVKDKNGNIIDEVAVGSAKTRREAQALEERFREIDTEGAEYTHRRDAKDEMSDNFKFDLEEHGYTSAQKVRGEALKGFKSDNSLGFSEIENPMESIVHSVKSISQRVAMRDWIETTKARLMQNYKDYLPPDGSYPAKAEDIFYRGRGVGDDKMAADARTLFNYIRANEDGYVNIVDDYFKNVFMNVADMFANKAIKSKGLKSDVYNAGEKAFQYLGDAKGPAAAAKSVVSTMLLFSHPLRQFVVQSAQHLQVLAVGNPSYVWTGKMYGHLNLVLAEIAGVSKHMPESVYKKLGTSKAEIAHIRKVLDESGQLAAVDKQNLVRGVLMDMADRQAASKLRKAVTAPLHAARRIGMDAGEAYNTIATYLTMYDKAKSMGKNMNDVMVLEDVALASRNFTGMMNAAGDMPYNHNILAIPMQFVQIGHKLVMNMTFNQQLTKAEKARLGAMNLLFFGIPAQQLLEKGFGQYLPEDEEVRNVIVEGTMSYLVNTALHNIYGTDTRLDIAGSISPLNSPQMNLALDILSGDFASKLATASMDSPVFGFSRKLGLFTREVANWVVPDPNLHPTDLTTVVKAGANMFSGMSAAFKASYLAEYNRSLSAKGVTQDYRTDNVAVVAAMLGISTMDEVQMRASQTLKYKTDKELDDDVKEWVRVLGEQSKLRDITVGGTDYNQKAVASGYALFGHSPGSYQKVRKHLMGAAKNGEWRAVSDVWDLYFQGSIEQAEEAARMLPNDHPDKQNVIDAIQTFRRAKEESELN